MPPCISITTNRWVNKKKTSFYKPLFRWSFKTCQKVTYSKSCWAQKITKLLLSIIRVAYLGTILLLKTKRVVFLGGLAMSIPLESYATPEISLKKCGPKRMGMQHFFASLRFMWEKWRDNRWGMKGLGSQHAVFCCSDDAPRKWTNFVSWKMVVGLLILSNWEGIFSGANC